MSIWELSIRSLFQIFTKKAANKLQLSSPYFPFLLYESNVIRIEIIKLKPPVKLFQNVLNRFHSQNYNIIHENRYNSKILCIFHGVIRNRFFYNIMKAGTFTSSLNFSSCWAQYIFSTAKTTQVQTLCSINSVNKSLVVLRHSTCSFILAVEIVAIQRPLTNVCSELSETL